MPLFNDKIRTLYCFQLWRLQALGPIKIEEWMLYALTDYIAYMPLIFFPFRKRLRHTKIVTYSALFVIAIGYIFLIHAMVTGVPPWLISLVSVFAAIGTMIWGLDVHPGKSMTVMLMEYCNASFIAVMAKSLEMYFFPESLHTLYRWTHSLFILIGVIALYFFDYFFTWKILEPTIGSPDEGKAWNYIWITPLSFYMVWFIYTYSSNSYLNAVPEDPIIITMLLFFEVGSLVTYFILLQLLYYESEKSRLEYQELLNRSQYKNLNSRIEEARKARHDVRHHFLVLESLAKENDVQGILDYLNQFSEKHSSDNVLVYCEHFSANALLSYYSQQAKNEQVKFSAKCNIPTEIGITDKDLTIILSNLLENAMHACLKVTDRPRQIQVICRYEDVGLTLIIKNTSMEAPRTDHSGRYISTSHKGYGIGIESVQTIVKSYNGMMHLDFDGEDVSVSIVLMV